MQNTSIYVHIPFCKHRCGYCDFNTYAGFENYIPDYVNALIEEIKWVGKAAENKIPVHTLFFGGGTPSLLTVDAVGKIISRAADYFDFQPEMEISLEANPGTLSLDYLKRLRDSGVNRLSFGMQSAHPDDLRLLERIHDTVDVIQSVKWARIAGFDQISLDLMFGLPFQTLERWKSSVETALSLSPEHLSLYALTLEHGTPFQHYLERGIIPMPDGDLAAEMYEWVCERLEKDGFAHYEISNWAKVKGAQIDSCRHNLQYWYNLPYLGFGAGAHGYAEGIRTANTRGIKGYIQQVNKTDHLSGRFPIGPAIEQVTPIDLWTEAQETMMVGLRLLEEGVADETFTTRFGLSLEQAFGPQIERLMNIGLLEWNGEKAKRLRLTRSGWLLGNQVFMQFIDLPEPEFLK